jgi:DNA-binding MarR family transcriptional regulator
MTTTEEQSTSPPDTQWLNDTEQRAWRAYVIASRMVNRAVDRDLKESYDLVSDDYGVLVILAESPGRRLRFGELAHALRFPKAHLTYRFQRLESQGFVERERCEDDGRGAYARLTDRGYEMLERASSFHVASVRRHLFDYLDEELVEKLDAAMSAVLGKRRAGDVTDLG